MGRKLPIEIERKPSHNEKYEALRKSVVKRYDQLAGDLDRSHQALYAFLGYIYETAAVINGDPALRSFLVQDVDELLNESREGKRRWQASKHDTFDLLLTLRFKLAPDTAVQKSGWLGALRAAHELKDDAGHPSPVGTTEQAFKEWIAPIGVYGARKLAAKRDTFDLCEFADGINADITSFTVELAEDAEPPGGMLLILGRVLGRQGRKADVALVEVILNERRVQSAGAWTAKYWERHHKADAKVATRNIDKAMMKEFGDPGMPEAVPGRSQASGQFLADAARGAK